MAILQDWKIRPTRAVCEMTGEAFVDGQNFYTCITEDPESDGFLRHDYSAEAWEQIKDALTPVPYSFWKSTFKASEKREEAVAHPMGTPVEVLLRRFLEEDDPRTEKARYILALMLERDKTLVQVDAQTVHSRKLLFYEHCDSSEAFIIVDPGLKLSEVESVQREVLELLTEEETKTVSEESGSVEEPPQPEGGEDEKQTQEDGYKSPESEDEAIPSADEETPNTV